MTTTERQLLIQTGLAVAKTIELLTTRLPFWMLNDTMKAEAVDTITHLRTLIERVRQESASK